MMDKNARTKLRNMGGIMASSPELMRVAQGFQVGGPVMPQAPLAPRTSGVTRPGTGAPLVGLGRVPPMMTAPVTPGTAPMMPLESAPGRFVAGQPPDPSVADGFFGLDPVRPAGLPGLADQGVEDPLEELMLGSGAVDRRDTTDDARAERGFGRSAYMSGLQGNVVDLPEDLEPSYSTVREDKGEVLSDVQEQIADLEEKQIGGVDPSSAAKRKRESLEAQARRLEGQIPKPTEEDLMAMPVEPKNLTQEQIDKAMSLVQKDPNWQVPETETTKADTDTDTPDGPPPPPPPPAPSKKDLRSRYKEKLELFKEIYGEKDEDRARDKAMSLAMIGLAIAAGQSPDALTNISQGLSVGLQGMGEQNRARREQERGLKTLALESAIGEQSAAAEAEAEAARMDLEQANKIELEEEKARINALYGAGSREARNIIDFTQNAYDSAFEAASGQTAPDYDSKVETPHQYAMRQAQQAAGGMQRMFPGYGGGSVGTSAPTGGTIPEVTNKAEYDALPPGAAFTQNGQSRVKPQQ
jgi:hypothetical protein